MAPNPLRQLATLGQRVWLDDLRRGWLSDGTLAGLIENDGLRGVTSNPAIFERAVSRGHDYDAAIAALNRLEHAQDDQLYEMLVAEDIRAAAGLLRTVYDASGGRDGYVSVEVSPHIADDTAATVASAQRLWDHIACPNVMVKVPATRAGLPAIQRLIAAGININVTLLFSVGRYREVAAAHMAGLEDRLSAGASIANIASVASFFLSRIDTWVDARLDKRDTPEAAALRGASAIGCARVAYQQYREMTPSQPWEALRAKGAQPQRLVWASTSTKDPAYGDTRYIDALIGPDTIVTMPFETLTAYRDHGRPALRIEDDLDIARALPDRLKALGIDLDEVAEGLEEEGIRKFAEPYDRLLASLRQRAAVA